MIQHFLFIHHLRRLFRSVAWQPFGSVHRGCGATPPAERREPSRERLTESPAAYARNHRRAAQGSFGHLRLDVCDH